MQSTGKILSGRFRGLTAAALLAIAGAASCFAGPALPSATVVSVQSAGAADLVLLGAGFDAGLREGMVCRITRAATTVADVQLVGLRSNCSAALILNLAPGQSIRAGDLASVKILKT